MLKLPKIIGISGKIGSGKTTLSKYIRDLYPIYQVKSFAENVRKTTSILTGIDIEEMRSDTDKNKYIEDYQKNYRRTPTEYRYRYETNCTSGCMG